jgi:hypothetical protein
MMLKTRSTPPFPKIIESAVRINSIHCVIEFSTFEAKFNGTNFNLNEDDWHSQKFDATEPTSLPI